MLKYHIKITENETDRSIVDCDISVLIGALFDGKKTKRMTFASATGYEIHDTIIAAHEETLYALDQL